MESADAIRRQVAERRLRAEKLLAQADEASRKKAQKKERAARLEKRRRKKNA